MRHSNKTSFKKGHPFSPESREKLRQTILKQYASGKRKPCWRKGMEAMNTEESRKRRKVGMLKFRPLGSRRKYRQNFDDGKKRFYWQVKVSETGKWKPEHRVIMEKHLNRKLNRKEHVHHINHDSLDNRIENLEILSSSEHKKRHPITSDGLKLISIKLRLKPGQWSRKFDRCIKCHKSDSVYQGHGLCHRCYEFLRRNNKKEKSCISSLHL